MLNKQIATAYRNFLNRSAELQQLVQPHLRGGFLPAAMVKDFAIEHSQFYQCSYAIRDSGSVTFYIADMEQKSENRHQAAQKAWQRGVGTFVKTTTKRGGATRNKQSVAEKWLRDFHKLDAADRRAILRLIKSEGLV